MSENQSNLKPICEISGALNLRSLGSSCLKISQVLCFRTDIAMVTKQIRDELWGFVNSFIFVCLDFSPYNKGDLTFYPSNYLTFSY